MIRSVLMISVPITHPIQRTQERDSEMIREITSIEHNIKYTLPFTKENIQKLYNLKNGRCSLVLMDESRGNKPPYEVESFEHFKTMEFDGLWDREVHTQNQARPFLW
jgi:hypothetical protein